MLELRGTGWVFLTRLILVINYLEGFARSAFFQDVDRDAAPHTKQLRPQPILIQDVCHLREKGLRLYVRWQLNEDLEGTLPELNNLKAKWSEQACCLLEQFFAVCGAHAPILGEPRCLATRISW